MRVVTGWVIVGLLVTACGSGQASMGATSDPASAPPATASAAVTAVPSPDAGEASPPLALMADVDIGGRSIHVECRGTAPPGVPTILLESGLEGSMANWSGGVRPALETRTKVCAYSRAGLGGSDPAPEATRTIEDMADDLEATLDAAGIAGPFLIAAHSLGPWISMVYTSRHPDDVVGLVLVDPRGPGVTQRWSDALGEPATGEPEAVTWLRTFVTGGYEDNIENLAFARSEAIASSLLDADGPFFGDRPVTVLSADGTIDEVMPEPGALREALRAASVDGQRRYADESTRGTFTVVEDSGHMMTDHQPAAVIEAVESMLENLGVEPTR